MRACASGPGEPSAVCAPISKVVMALHHVSHLCRDVEVTKHFYMTVLGFEEVRRPASFEFEGSWCASSSRRAARSTRRRAQRSRIPASVGSCAVAIVVVAHCRSVGSAPDIGQAPSSAPPASGRPRRDRAQHSCRCIPTASRVVVCQRSRAAVSVRSRVSPER